MLPSSTRGNNTAPDRERRSGLRLELSGEGRYALRALVYLARTGTRVPAGRIAAEAGIPPRLLVRVLARLARAGLVEGTPGRGGGSRLARPAQEITLRQAVESVEGPFGVTRCIMHDRVCGSGSPCALHEAWAEAQAAMLRRLDEETLADFLSGTAYPESEGGSQG